MSIFTDIIHSSTKHDKRQVKRVKVPQYNFKQTQTIKLDPDDPFLLATSNNLDKLRSAKIKLREIQLIEDEKQRLGQEEYERQRLNRLKGII